jgi:hypothetical protein
MSLKQGEPCRVCKRPITAKIILEKRLERAENARRSAAKAKANGKHLGRKKIRNDEEIEYLRRMGHSIREIAFKQKVSTTAIQRSLECAGLKGIKFYYCREPQCWCRITTGSQPAEKK